MSRLRTGRRAGVPRLVRHPHESTRTGLRPELDNGPRLVGTVSPSAAVGSPTVRPEAAASSGPTAWTGSRAAAARSNFFCSFSTRASEREAAVRSAAVSFFQRSAFSFALASFVSVLVS